MSKNQTVYVSILDKDYQVGCPKEEQVALNSAAAELDRRMREIKASGAIIGVERVAVMAALNLCHELQQSRASADAMPDIQSLERIVNKLDFALESVK